MSEAFLGEIRMFAGTREPENWAFCDGRTLSVSTYQALFSLIGTSYGGDGTTTFCLPDLRGRLPIGQGTGTGMTPRTIAASGGTETVAIETANLPAHNHPMVVSTKAATTVDPINAAYASFTAGTTTTGLYRTLTSGTGVTKQTFNDGFVAPTGGNQAHANLMPSFGVNFIMALVGAYPPRPN